MTSQRHDSTIAATTVYPVLILIAFVFGSCGAPTPRSEPVIGDGASKPPDEFAEVRTLQDAYSIPNTIVSVRAYEVSEDVLEALTTKVDTKWLDLYGDGSDEITSRTLSKLAHLTSLEHLSIVNVQNLDDAALAAIASLPNLIELAIYGGSATGNGVSSLVRLSGLRLLKLQSVPCENDDALLELGGIETLRELVLDDVNAVSDRILTMCAKLPQLASLRISRCDRFTAVGLSELAHCRALTELNLSFNEHLDPQHLLSIRSLENLTHLDLHYCRSVSNEVVGALADLHGLKKLDLSDCPGIGNPAAADLVRLTNLELLNLRRTNVSSSTLKWIAAQLSDTEVLS